MSSLVPALIIETIIVSYTGCLIADLRYLVQTSTKHANPFLGGSRSPVEILKLFCDDRVAEESDLKFLSLYTILLPPTPGERDRRRIYLSGS